MTLMDWDEGLDIGIETMNMQHKGLLDLMNKLYDLHNEGANFDDIKVVLEDLAAKTVKHFQEEEAYMESIGFEGLGPHKIIHKNLLKDFTQHQENFLTSRKFEETFFTFLKVWLSAHIKGIDKKYGEKAQAA